MAARYQIQVRDTSGAVTGFLADWVRLKYTRRVNGVGEFLLVIDQTNPNLAAFILDAQVEVRRQDLAASPVIDQYTDFSGFNRTTEYKTSDADADTFLSVGATYEHLLARRVVAYPVESSGAAKTGAGETVMKAYVDENAGVLATVANGRQRGGAFSGFSVQADAAGGGAWTGDRAGRRLLDVLREIGDATDVDFEVISTGPATWAFRAQARPIGADRTVTGLDPSSGLNAAGNVPVIFSLQAANMGAPSFSVSRVNEMTVAIVQGQGIHDDRIVAVVTSTAILDSPWNDMEANFDANEEDTPAGLAAVGASKLEQLQAREVFAFDVLQQPGTLYGRDYFVGDLVTARYLTFERSVQIAAITVEVIGGVEQITAELTNVT